MWVEELMKDYNIGTSSILDALESIKSGELGSTQTVGSLTTYILCPESKTLWDLKIVVGLALNAAGFRDEFNTADGLYIVKSLGFDCVQFSSTKGRKLGVKGFDIDELNDAHTVYYSDGRQVENGFAPEEKEVTDSEGNKTKSWVSRHIRNQIFVKQIKDAAKGVCDACKTRTFETKSGEWFLEVHHKKWLSKGGLDEPENMVALCPNCHRQEHLGKSPRY